LRCASDLNLGTVRRIPTLPADLGFAAVTSGAPTDRTTLQRQYADGSTLDARSSIHEWQTPAFATPNVCGLSRSACERERPQIL
jgi:hypothetical protein